MIIHNTDGFIFKFSDAERSCTINFLLLYKLKALDMKITVTTFTVLQPLATVQTDRIGT